MISAMESRGCNNSPGGQQRIGIWGWSYGGHMTLHAMFQASDLFKVGFAGGPVTDWHYYDSIYTERYMGMPQQHKAIQNRPRLPTPRT